MQGLTETSIYCPYCGEPNQVLLDPQEVGQSYIEDCQVCCRPIEFVISTSGEDVSADVFTDSE